MSGTPPGGGFSLSIIVGRQHKLKMRAEFVPVRRGGRGEVRGEVGVPASVFSFPMGAVPLASTSLI